MSFRDEFKHMLSLGRELSEVHPFFKEIAMLGHKDAEDYALLEVMKGFFPDNEAIIEGFQEITQLVGYATFLKECKEITRLTLALGDTRKRESAKDWNK